MQYKVIASFANVDGANIINHNSRDITGVGVAHDIKSPKKLALIFPNDDKAVFVR